MKVFEAKTCYVSKMTDEEPSIDQIESGMEEVIVLRRRSSNFFITISRHNKNKRPVIYQKFLEKK